MTKVMLRVVEHVSGNWFHHVAELGSYTALCGERAVMNTNIPIHRWGESCGNVKIKYRWCGECREAMRRAEERGGNE